MEISKSSEKNTDKKSSRGRYNLYLLLTAIIWGSGFILQKIGSNTLTSFTFNGIRYFLAALMVLAIARFKLPAEKTARRLTILAGVFLFIAAHLQQIGIQHTSVANAGFITTIYVVLVPFLSFLIFRHKIRKSAYLAAGVAFVGLYLLSTSGKTLDQISIGDVIVFIGSIFWAIHILIVSKATSRTDPVQFSAGQFLVCAILNLICWLVIDGAPVQAIPGALPILLYSGLIVIGTGFTLQAVAQKHTDESQAALILGLEAVFAAIFGVLLFKETFTWMQIFGAVLIFLSVVISVKSKKAETVSQD